MRPDRLPAASAAALLLISSYASAQQAPPANTPTHGTAPQPRSAPNTAVNNEQAAMVARRMQETSGSLLQASLAAAPDPSQAKLAQVSFIAVPDPEPRVLKKHDLVTIIVHEESDSSASGTTDLKKTADIDAHIDQYLELNLKELAIHSNTPTTPAGIKAAAARNFKGEATADRTDTMTARITGEILDVKPNGTLVVQARKRIRVEDEDIVMILTGICRTDDIAPDNTVLSTQMYDVDFEKNTKGAVRDTTKRGLIPRLLDFINPF